MDLGVASYGELTLLLDLSSEPRRPFIRDIIFLGFFIVLLKILFLTSYSAFLLTWTRLVTYLHNSSKAWSFISFSTAFAFLACVL